ncbi:hypothetical protein CBR_g38727 [Chara braunii]|uniref:Uncharacterized protein n=1 Tax=Chara braunii TaxID=69332 RepID=A0A388LQH0_CHABU|nr:hypothetical protein CBR_g38727 [Chara braunii]|eukprot:GBG84442.1 hypothetical protein CBR_g38727 [Chara braunii]
MVEVAAAGWEDELVTWRRSSGRSIRSTKHEADEGREKSQCEEEERRKREKEEEDRRQRDKKEREDFQAQMHKEMSAKLDRVCDAVNGKKASDSEEVMKLKAQVEALTLQHRESTAGEKKSGEAEEVARLKLEVESLKRGRDVASTSATVTTGESEEVSRLRREYADMRAVTDWRLASLEEVIHALQKQCEAAENNVEAWRLEALRPGNKRGSVAIGQCPITEARVRPRVTLYEIPRAVSRVNGQLKAIVERHQQEVDLLKEMRLKEVNARKESEEEVERLKEAMARLGTSRKTKGTNLRTRLDEVAGPSSRKDKGKAPASPDTQAVDRDVLLKNARRQLRNLKKDDVVAFCEKEGITYTKLDLTKEAIAQRRAGRAFGDDDTVTQVRVRKMTKWLMSPMTGVMMT